MDKICRSAVTLCRLQRVRHLSVRSAATTSTQNQDNAEPAIVHQLGMKTDGRTHTFSLSTDTVIKYIKLGAINKNLALQYCHYLAHLCRHADPQDLEHYIARVANLTLYVLKHHKDLPPAVRLELLVDSASTSSDTCSMVCGKLLDEHELWTDMDAKAITGLLSACYKFRLWDKASTILEKCGPKNFYSCTFDALVTGIGEFLHSNKVKPEERDHMKQSLFDHLTKLFRFSRERRIPFVTEQPEVIVQSLEQLMPDFFRRPVFKMSGRCTHCNTHIPLYDHKAVPLINKSIRQVLDRQHLGNLHLCSSKRDIENFYSFIENLLSDKKPIDCVIDGLNLAYKNSYGYIISKQKLTSDFEKTIKRHDSRFQVQVIVNAIIRSNILDKFRKILVIGKAHMEKWPGLLDFFKKNNIHFYASDNQAKDDLFMLYASTLSPRTVFVTNDFLRDHVSLLNDESRTDLERYIDTHQVWIERKTLRAIWPTPFEKIPFVDESCSHFHIPMIDSTKIDLLAQHEPPAHLNNKITTWLCCSTKRLSDTVAEDASRLDSSEEIHSN